MWERARRKEARGDPRPRGVRRGTRVPIRYTNPGARCGKPQPRSAGVSRAAGAQRVSTHAFAHHLLTLHSFATQDAAGPPGPRCARPAARLRLAGAPVREHRGRA